jgi:hypothetical protein
MAEDLKNTGPLIRAHQISTSVVVFGSNTSTANQLSESMRSAEALRAALIGRFDIRLLEDAPANRQA